MRKLLFLFAGIALALLLYTFWPAPAAERAAWAADYEALKRFTETSYANLGDRLASRKISPRELDQRTRAALAAARTRRAARAAISSFVATFDDHHFRAEAPYGPARKALRRLLGKDRKQPDATIGAGATASEVCAALGARDRRNGDLDWEAAGLVPLPGDAATVPFPAGTIARGGAPPLAVLRIGLFSAQGFPEHCEAEWPRFLATPEGKACTDCLDPFWDHLQTALVAALERELRALEAAGASTLLVDLTGNGGGNEVVGRMAALVSPRPLVRRAGGFLRQPHWSGRFAREVEAYRAQAERPQLTAEQRAFVDAARARTEAMLAEATTPCDLSGIWASDATTLPCSNVARAAPFLELPSPELVRGLELESMLLDSAVTPGEPGIWRGTVWIATDRATASASEDFVASLSDSGAARLVGERTMGIGCGYTDGGVKLELAAVGMTIRTPDCVRYRADGTNEAEGIAPDVAIPDFQSLAGAERAAQVIAAIGTAR